jgi:hypothetical protein
MKRLSSVVGYAGLLLSIALAIALAAPGRVEIVEGVACDNGRTVDVAFVIGSSPHSVFFVRDGQAVLTLMSYTFADRDTGDVLLSASHPMHTNQPTTTCTGVDPNFDSSRGTHATFNLGVEFTPAKRPWILAQTFSWNSTSCAGHRPPPTADPLAADG